MARGYLAGFGFSVDVVIDVGVAAGTEWLYRAFPDRHFVLIDPLEETGDLLKAGSRPESFDLHLTALGAEAGSVRINVPKGTAGGDLLQTSALERIDALAGAVEDSEIREVPMTPLDAITANYPGRLGLKIDTEGFEHEVLKGASETLKRCEFVILELSLEQRFRGIGPPSGIISLLAGYGLELRDVLALSPSAKSSPPRHCDALFTRWPGNTVAAER